MTASGSVGLVAAVQDLLAAMSAAEPEPTRSAATAAAFSPSPGGLPPLQGVTSTV